MVTVTGWGVDLSDIYISRPEVESENDVLTRLRMFTGEKTQLLTDQTDEKVLDSLGLLDSGNGNH